MKEWKLKKVIQILTACLAMIVVLNVSGISMKTMQTIDINKKESKTNRRDSNLQMESETRETISRILNEQIQTELPQIAITFDDGPNASSTPILLDGLKERKVRATFFLIGENVEKDENEKIVKRMYEEGHLIGNHTYTHCNLSKLETGEAKKELEQTDTVIEKITGKQPVFVRAPYGELPVDSEQDLNRIYIGWTVDPLDWMTEDTGAVVKTVVEEINPGDVILLHDCYPSSVQAAIRIVDLLQGKGYEFVTVDHLIMD